MDDLQKKIEILYNYTSVLKSKLKNILYLNRTVMIKNILLLLLSQFAILQGTYSQTLTYKENLNNMVGTVGVTELKDSLLFMTGVNSGNMQYSSGSVDVGLILFDADTPSKILHVINADMTTTIADYISDGNGGFFIAGYLGVFNGIIIQANTVVHITKNMTMIRTPVSFNNKIDKLTLFNNRLLVTGKFTTINGNSCPNITALDTALQVIPSFNTPFTSAACDKSIQYKGQLLILGVFTYQGINYNMLGIDPATGNVIKAYTNLPLTSTRLEIWNDILFLCSDSKITNPVSHGFLYSYDLINMSLSSNYNIRSNSYIYAINVVNQRLYLSIYKTANQDTIRINGSFHLSQGLATINMFQLNLETPTTSLDDETYKLIGYKDKLFRCGILNFTSGISVNHFIAIDTINYKVLNSTFPLYNPKAKRLAVSDNIGMVDYYLGVNFEPKFSMGLLNLKTLKFTDFNPRLSNTGSGVLAIKAFDSIVFLAGDINTAEGITIKNFVAYNFYTNIIDSSYNLKFNRPVYAMEILNDSILLIGGEFDNVNSQPYYSFVAYNYRAKRISNNYLGGFDGGVHKIVKIDSLLFFSGSFTKVNNLDKRNFISATVDNLALNYNYGKFFTRMSYPNSIKKNEGKYYISANIYMDSSLIVFDANGNRLEKECLMQSNLVSMTTLKNYMIFGGTFTYFNNNYSYSNLVSMQADNNYPMPNTSIQAYNRGVTNVVNWGDSVVFYFTYTINKIVLNPSPNIETPTFISGFSCKKTGSIPYKSNGTFNPGNSFILEASTNSLFTTPIVISSVNSTASQGLLPVNLVPLAYVNYTYRIRSTNPVIKSPITEFNVYHKPIGSFKLLSGDTNCLAYSFGTYDISLINISSVNKIIIENGTQFPNYTNSYKIIVKWNNGPIGRIKLVMSDINQCSIDTGIITVHLTMSPYGGISNSLYNEVFVYPNVVQNELHVQNENHHQLKITITDINGRIVFATETNSSVSIPTSSMAAGFYIVYLNKEQENKTIKIIKN